MESAIGGSKKRKTSKFVHKRGSRKHLLQMGKKKGKQHEDAGEGSASQASLADFLDFPSLDGQAMALPDVVQLPSTQV